MRAAVFGFWSLIFKIQRSCFGCCRVVFVFQEMAIFGCEGGVIS